MYTLHYSDSHNPLPYTPTSNTSYTPTPDSTQNAPHDLNKNLDLINTTDVSVVILHPSDMYEVNHVTLNKQRQVYCVPSDVLVRYCTFWEILPIEWIT